MQTCQVAFQGPFIILSCQHRLLSLRQNRQASPFMWGHPNVEAVSLTDDASVLIPPRFIRYCTVHESSLCVWLNVSHNRTFTCNGSSCTSLLSSSSLYRDKGKSCVVNTDSLCVKWKCFVYKATNIQETFLTFYMEQMSTWLNIFLSEWYYTLIEVGWFEYSSLYELYELYVCLLYSKQT